MDLEQAIESKIESYKAKLDNLKYHRAQVCDKQDDAANEALDDRINDFAEFIRVLNFIESKRYRDFKDTFGR